MVRQVLLSAVGVVLVLVAGELAVRTREPASTVDDPSEAARTYGPHPLYGWAPLPGAEFTGTYEGIRFTGRYSSVGHLGHEPRPDAPLSILAVGDSMTEARQVPGELRFSELLEQALRRDLGVAAQVLNAGRSGYQTDQELLYYENEGRVLRPHVVLLFLFVGNDIMGNTQSMSPTGQGDVAKPRFRLVDGTLTLAPPDEPDQHKVAPTTALVDPKTWLRTHSSLYRIAGRAWARLRGAAADPMPYAYEVYRTDDPPATLEAWAVTEALLQRFRESVEREGSVFALVIIPDQNQVESDAWDALIRRHAPQAGRYDPDVPERRLREICARQRIHCLDLLSLMRSSPKRLFVSGDGHLSKVGHQLVADATSGWLRALLP